jgi:hypothetical protein
MQACTQQSASQRSANLPSMGSKSPPRLQKQFNREHAVQLACCAARPCDTAGVKLGMGSCTCCRLLTITVAAVNYQHCCCYRLCHCCCCHCCCCPPQDPLLPASCRPLPAAAAHSEARPAAQTQVHAAISTTEVAHPTTSLSCAS